MRCADGELSDATVIAIFEQLIRMEEASDDLQEGLDFIQATCEFDDEYEDDD